jgi:hypothetical protein
MCHLSQIDRQNLPDKPYQNLRQVLTAIAGNQPETDQKKTDCAKPGFNLSIRDIAAANRIKA